DIISSIRRVSGRRGKPVAILADLQGPKIRTGKMQEGGVFLTKGEKVTITTEKVVGRKGLIPTTYMELPQDVKAGAHILMDDGLLELRVVSVEGERVECMVVEGGLLKDNKGINLPGVSVSAPSLTDKDRLDLEFCLDQRVDYVALSFVRRASDLEEIKNIISERGLSIPVVAKIEKPEALRNFKSILRSTDAVMVARGDLGVELRPERVPLIQKKIIRMCNAAGKPVITATQMLESMISHPRPTRAETSDVANAILDGTDAVMLSGETASGSHPVAAVKAMVKVALDVERSELWRVFRLSVDHTDNTGVAVAEAACHAASMLRAKAIVAFTHSGRTAQLVSKFRPQLPIIAITPFPEIQRRLSLCWGIRSIIVEGRDNTDQQIAAMEERLLSDGFRKGDVVVITMGVPVSVSGSTNLIKVHKLDIGDFFEIF
ncbi:MAG TPA: pyruvate kinase, partial [Verrucomicrobiae bacterium]|nr:pyruvate kinase [Verrucomicrobiae bacterium]